MPRFAIKADAYGFGPHYNPHSVTIRNMNTRDVISIYNRTAHEYAQSRVGTEDTAELNQFQTLIKPGSKVLDVGCAAGRDTRLLKDMGFDVVGADLADKLLAIAKESNPDIRFVKADMRKLPFEDQSFDALWVSAVLHHLDRADMPSALKEFKRVLAEHGILYVHTKAGSGALTTREQTVLGGEREFELITCEELEQMLDACGFAKLRLEEKESKSRPGLRWINAYYQKR